MRFPSLFLVSLSLLLSGSAPAATSPGKPPNIVVFLADDWRYDTLGIAGNPVVKTPHLDQLAREAVRFTQNCVTTSVCWVSRATRWTNAINSVASPASLLPPPKARVACAAAKPTVAARISDSRFQLLILNLGILGISAAANLEMLTPPRAGANAACTPPVARYQAP